MAQKQFERENGIFASTIPGENGTWVALITEMVDGKIIGQVEQPGFRTEALALQDAAETVERLCAELARQGLISNVTVSTFKIENETHLH